MGWINARTGKGSVDDYFLAHSSNTKFSQTIKCSDGAESCPDESKPVIRYNDNSYEILRLFLSLFPKMMHQIN